MTNKHPGLWTNSEDDSSIVDSQLEAYRNESIAEPVTPPANAHAGNHYHNHQYSLHAKSFTPHSQYSPNLTIREHAPYACGYTGIGNSNLASPVDTPALKPYNSQQPSYLSTPHTPLAANKGDNGSIPSTPSTTSRPLSMTGRHSASNSTGIPPFPGMTPLGHTRSYSYNLRDPQHSLSRMSLSSNTVSNLNMQERELRPRAYSSGLAGTPIPLKGSVNANNGRPNQHSLEVSAAHYPFPPPLSSPISPENISSMASHYGHQRHQYQPSFSSSLNDEQPVNAATVATTANPNTHNHHNHNSSSSVIGTEPDVAPLGSQNLHRSLSSISVMSGFVKSNGLHNHISNTSPYEEASGDAYGFPIMSAGAGSNVHNNGSNNSLAHASNSATSLSRRSTTSLSKAVGRQRRSSSGASSISFIEPATSSGGAGSGTAAAVSDSQLAGVKNQINTNVDPANATDQQIYSLCKDQRGCRYLQRKLGEGDSDVIRRVFGAIHPHVVTLMMDPFGNYLCQKLFEYCSQEEITRLLMVTAPSLSTIAVNQHGTRALQKLIDAVKTPDQVNILVGALDGHVVRLIRDLNGNHVIQKLLLDLDARGSQFIYDAVCKSVIEIGSHRHGCCVLQRCLDYAQDYNRNNLVAHIVAQALVLVCDPFGNYVCQYVIDLGVPDYTDSLARQLLGKISSLSVQKFSSNVVEKCLRSSSPELQRAMVMEIMLPRTLHDLLLDNYGNYVIQTALESSSSMDTDTKQQLAVSIHSALNTTRSPYGRRVMSKLKTW